MKKRLTLTLATLLVSLMSLYGTPATEGLRQRLAGHIEYLAGSDLMGRKAGTEGAQAAARYIADEFALHGLAPFDSEEYILPFGRGNFRNVVGQIEGEVADTYIIIGAHYDHLGTNRRGEIFHGADDNASGVAALIEVARTVAESGYEPHHTLLFVAFDAEEEWLLGSEALVEMLPTGSVRAMINMDMVGRLEGGALSVEGVGTLAECEDLVQSLATNHTIPILAKPFERGVLTATDTEPFAKRGIPTLALTTGPHGDFHKPSDTSEKIDIGGLGQVVGFAADLLRELDHNGQIVPTGRVARKHQSDILTFGLSAGVGSSAHLHPTVATSVGLATNIGFSVQYVSNYWALRTGIHYDRQEGYTLDDSIPQPHIREGALIPFEVIVKSEGAINIFASAGAWVALPRVEWGASWGLGCRIGLLSIEGVSRHGLTPTKPTRTTLCILGVYF